MKCLSQYLRIMSLKMRWPWIWATFGIQTIAKQINPTSYSNDTEYYQYILCNVHDVVVAMENPKEIMHELEVRISQKDASVKEPDVFLGVDVKKWYKAQWEKPGKFKWAIHIMCHCRCWSDWRNGQKIANKSHNAVIEWIHARTWSGL